ncbi:3-hydroxyacyl-ACP dehydratase FabZ family protein [Butyrivibrio sp. AD3002]|uniref:3-hydroxyacyl-ACP dehydratase FabZ family protein n=1 Tax=Butyrivibrio sp. AD3002 TaxID=1280670 RepID=UPI0003B79340|nr:3-hydroxyacyl-ACP dehydratase FabZ family protein [Butyrivibrio sp. AD3002]
MKKYGKEIYSLIPNRYPFMILHSLEVGNNCAEAEIVLKEDDWFFECHYPGNPILPLTLLLESMTQTFSATFLKAEETEDGSKFEIPVISSIGPLRMTKSAGPGDVIRIEAKLGSFKRGIAKGVCTAYINEDEKPIMEIEIVDALKSQMVKMQ